MDVLQGLRNASRPRRVPQAQLGTIVDDRSGRADQTDGQKLKTYQTSPGFFDLAIAAPSMKAALEA
jgi:hypothetical protein